jgi:hypothetical protein
MSARPTSSASRWVVLFVYACVDTGSVCVGGGGVGGRMLTHGVVCVISRRCPGSVCMKGGETLLAVEVACSPVSKPRRITRSC